VKVDISSVKLSKTSFLNDWKKLPEDVKAEGRQRIADLVCNGGAPKKLRLHSLNGYNPKIYKIDLESGKGKRYQATFQLEDGVAVFLRAGTHKQIDRSPA